MHMLTLSFSAQNPKETDSRQRHQPALRVVIADDEPHVRQALALICEDALGLQVTGAASDATELLGLMRAARPDIVLLAWGLPDMPMPALIRQLRLQATCRLIVVGAYPESRPDALMAGADAFISKSEPPEKLLKLLQTIKDSGRLPD